MLHLLSLFNLGSHLPCFFIVLCQSRNSLRSFHFNDKIATASATLDLTNIIKQALIAGIMVMGSITTHARVIVETPAYSWVGDTVVQGEYRSVAVDSGHIVSSYHAQPGYYMGIKPEWRLHNDISAYPTLETPNTMHKAVYNMGLDEMVNAVEPDTTLRTGAAWGGVWTRDVSYSIILSMAYMQPEASMVSLRRKVDPHGRIIQDTGSGGAWPVSTDRAVWGVAAYEIYKVTGDRQWLEYIYPIIKKSLDDDIVTAFDAETGLFKGETSFIDWRVQSYPRWMQTANIAESIALGTNVVFKRALEILATIAGKLGYADEHNYYGQLANDLAVAINEKLWMDDEGLYAMYLYGGDNRLVNPRAETLGESLAILWNVADEERAREVTENNPTTPFGMAIFYPQISDVPPYHNNALWPWVASFWAMANAKVGNEDGVVEAIGSVVRPAALFCTNKENFVLDNGDIATQLNSSNMLWCLAGNIALTHKVLFGIEYGDDELAFHPFVPKVFGDNRSLKGFPYRDATLDINIKGYGNRIKSFKLDDMETEPRIEAKLNGRHTVDIEMDSKDLEPIKMNRCANAKAPVTPIAWLADGCTLEWNPIEEIEQFVVVRDGEVVDTVKTLTYELTEPGEYSVMAVGASGIESFMSQPVSNRPKVTAKPKNLTQNVASKEVLVQPTAPIEGYHGDGFAEIDRTTGVTDIEVKVPEEGTYGIRLRYANGNGPTYTGNSCAVRTLWVDGERVGVVAMPHRGEGSWDDWGLSTMAKTELKKGKHTISITLEPQNENINYNTNHFLLDRVELVKL